MRMSVKQVITMLEENGWKYSSTRGDHHKFVKEGVKRPIIVAGKKSDDLAEGTLLSILRQAGLKDIARKK